MKIMPQARSRSYLKNLGYIVETVEKDRKVFDPKMNTYKSWKVDCLGCFDLIAIHSTRRGVCFIQVTSNSNTASRKLKIESEEVKGHPGKFVPRESTITVLRAGNAVELHTWGLRGPRGGRKTIQLTRYVLKLTAEELSWSKVEEEDDGFEIQPSLLGPGIPADTI